jgi:ABC-2 type transport system permease protein
MMLLFFKLIAVSIRSQMQYPASFAMLAISQCLGMFVDFLGLWVLFDRFNMVKGWTLYEVGLIYGIVHMGFAIAEAFARGFDRFSSMIKMGDFDRLLVRPQSPLFQIAASDVQIMKIGRFTQGLIILIWSASHLAFSLFSFHSLIIVFSVLGTACLFYGLFVIQATLSFWTVESLEVMNITTYGGVQTGQYPISIYPKSFRLIFTLLIPLACVGYYPIASLLQHETVPFWLGCIAPLAGFAFLFLACQLWRFGVRRYRSTGS